MSSLLVFLILFLGTANCQLSLDDLLEQIAAEMSTTSVPITDLPQENIGCEAGKQCVPLYQCDDFSSTINGETLINSQDLTQRSPCGSLQQCCSKVKTKPIERPESFKRDCGYRNIEGIGFRVSGISDTDTQFGEFPWMAAILQRQTLNNQQINMYQCGGSIIHPSVVLTIAHCVWSKQPSSFIIRGGEWETQSKTEILPSQDRDVSEIIIHENYHRGSFHNNIAMIILQEPFTFDEHINSICLPPPSAIFNNNRCYVSGWGKDQFGQAGQYQVILKKVDLPVIPGNICENSLRKTKLGPNFNLHESFICAGGEAGKGICKGDGGSPLVCPIVAGVEDRYYLAGNVAYGIGCGGEIPSLYTNVAHLRTWIDKQMANKNFQTNQYTP